MDSDWEPDGELSEDEGRRVVVEVRRQGGKRRRPGGQPRSKGSWSAEEDARLIRLVGEHGEGSWSTIAASFPGRIGKQCRERWHNQLRPDIKRDAWTDEEELLLIATHRELGNRWAEIAKRIPGRTENAVKNHWNATLRRKGDAPGGQQGSKGAEGAARPVSLLKQYMRRGLAAVAPHLSDAGVGGAAPAPKRRALQEEQEEEGSQPGADHGGSQEIGSAGRHGSSHELGAQEHTAAERSSGSEEAEGPASLLAPGQLAAARLLGKAEPRTVLQEVQPLQMPGVPQTVFSMDTAPQHRQAAAGTGAAKGSSPFLQQHGEAAGLGLPQRQGAALAVEIPALPLGGPWLPQTYGAGALGFAGIPSASATCSRELPGTGLPASAAAEEAPPSTASVTKQWPGLQGAAGAGGLPAWPETILQAQAGVRDGAEQQEAQQPQAGAVVGGDAQVDRVTEWLTRANASLVPVVQSQPFPVAGSGPSDQHQPIGEVHSHAAVDPMVVLAPIPVAANLSAAAGAAAAVKCTPEVPMLGMALFTPHLDSPLGLEGLGPQRGLELPALSELEDALSFFSPAGLLPNPTPLRPGRQLGPRPQLQQLTAPSRLRRTGEEEG